VLSAKLCEAMLVVLRTRLGSFDFYQKAKFGRVDLLVNNAGVAPLNRTDILEATEEKL